MPGEVSSSIGNLLTLRQKEARLAWDGTLSSIPIIVYSYTSRAFPRRTSELFRVLHQRTPTILVSLSDLWSNEIKATDFKEADAGGLRFLDSGTFENRIGLVDLTGRALPAAVYGDIVWDEIAYVAAARRFAKRGHVLLSYDRTGASIYDQMRDGLRLFEDVEDLKIVQDLILHVQNPDDIKRIAETFQSCQAQPAILAVAFDDIPGGWARRARYIRQLRNALNRVSTDRYVYLHLLGCIDPGSVAYFFWAGADIFDGSGWLQYHFARDYHACIFKDYELQTDGRKRPAVLLERMARSNIRVLEKLGHALTGAALNAEGRQFQPILDRVSKVLETVIM